MKILYLCPDLTFSSGGIRRLYTHVRILKENGFDTILTSCGYIADVIAWSMGIEQIRPNGIETVARFQGDMEKESLLTFWTRFFETHMK